MKDWEIIHKKCYSFSSIIHSDIYHWSGSNTELISLSSNISETSKNCELRLGGLISLKSSHF